MKCRRGEGGGTAGFICIWGETRHLHRDELHHLDWSLIKTGALTAGVEGGTSVCAEESVGVSHAAKESPWFNASETCSAHLSLLSSYCTSTEMAGQRDWSLPWAQLTISCHWLSAAACGLPQPGKRSLSNQPDWFHVIKGPGLVPTDSKAWRFIHDKGVAIRPAENLLRVNKIKISNQCLGGGNEPFKFLIKMNQLP